MKERICQESNRWVAIAVGLVVAISVANAQSFKAEVTGQGEPVILIPGLTCSGDVWKETVDQLKSDYECHVLTLPGFADQAALEEMPEHWLYTMRDEIYAYANENKLKKPTLIGHSLGGFLSLSLGSRYPDFPERIVVVDALPFMPAGQSPKATVESSKPLAENMRKMMLAGYGSDSAREASQKQMLGFMIGNQERIPEALKWGLDSDINTVAQSMYELQTTDIRNDLPKISVPTIVLGSWVGYKQWGFTEKMIKDRFDSQYANLKA